MMIPELAGPWFWYVGATLSLLVLTLLLNIRQPQVKGRLASVSVSSSISLGNSGFAPGLLRESGQLDRETKRRLIREGKKQRLHERMAHAGFYSTVSGSAFVFFRLLLIVSSAGLGFLISTMGSLTWTAGMGIGTACGVAATIAPGFWLDHRKKIRQTKIRRALPDALDVMVVCLQGGLSLMATISRVAGELATAHPMLAMEFKFAECQMQMGQTAGEAIRGIAERFDLEELRGMSAVIKQAERLGTSIASAIEVFAETLRLKRTQRAEEMAHKAAVKLLIPTVLCIFPAIFVVILGPAAIQIYNNLIHK
jgi:tight adherence protein C